MKRDIRIEREFDFPPELVWRAITDSRELGAWFMETDFQPQLHRQFTFTMKPQKGWDGITHCEVTELEVPRHVAYTYRGHATGAKPIECAGHDSEKAPEAMKGLFFDLDTVLSFTLTPRNGGTHLLVEHKGYQGWKLVIVSYIMGYGWTSKVLPRLAKTLPRMAGEPNADALNRAACGVNTPESA